MFSSLVSTKLTSQRLFSPKKHGKAGNELNAPCLQTLAHTCVHSCPRSLRLWEFVRHKRGFGAAVTEVKTAALRELIR